MDFENYTNKIIVSRVKVNLENELYTRLKSELNSVVTVESVTVKLDSNYQIEEVIITIKENSLPLVEVAIDRIIAEYNIPNSMLKIVAKGE